MPNLGNLRWSMITVAVAVVTALVVHAADKAADATGTWKWSATFGGNSVETVLKLKQEGDKLTGTITGFQGQDNEIKDGKLADGKVSFKVVTDFGGAPRTTTYTGTLEGDSLKGKAETVFSRDFDAKRSAPAK